ncbi:MAG: hypothetical protein DBY17_00970 [Oscillospiraceae bacterium]|nr:MAG: hypothetical protein DBY17_00970 [Oscillospiraceae bacterium]
MRKLCTQARKLPFFRGRPRPAPCAAGPPSAQGGTCAPEAHGEKQACLHWMAARGASSVPLRWL